MDLPTQWRSHAREIGKILRDRPRESVAILLGAGASISSGAPTTAQVSDVVHSRIGARVPESDFRRHMDRVDASERRAIIAPLFSDVSPNIGYQALAALGRTRRVVAVTFNWDDALEQACAALGVACRTYDVLECEQQHAAALDLGVEIIHAHGTLTDPRFGLHETLRFEKAERAHIVGALRQAPIRIAIGISVLDDLDLREVLNEAAIDNLRFFSRPGSRVSEQNLDLLRSIRATPGFVESPDVDFDRVMALVLEEFRQASWDSFALEHDLPPESELVKVNDDVTRPALRGRCVVVDGEPDVGKSTFVARLAYHCSLALDLVLRRNHGPSECMQALGVAQPEQVLVLDDPFGHNGKAENPGFAQALAAASQVGARLYVTSRVTDRLAAIAGSVPDVVTISINARECYAPSDLLQLVETKHPRSPELLSRVLADIGATRLQTPAQVRRALDGLSIDHPQAVAAKLEFLRASPTIATKLVEVRLAEFTGFGLELTDLEQELGPRAPHAVRMIRQRDLEGRTYGILNHATDHEAVDILLESEFEARRSNADDDTIRALDIWKAMRSVADGDYEPLKALSDEMTRHAAARLVARSAKPGETLAALLARDLDFWALCEVANELVRVWDAVGSSRRGMLKDILAKRPLMGAYAVLESCLYLQAATHSEVAVLCAAALWDLLAATGTEFEIALCIDGLFWRNHPSVIASADWEIAAFARLSDQQRAALVNFLAAYHPDGFHKGAPHRSKAFRSVDTVPWGDEAREFASRLVGWHYTHQARARSQFFFAGLARTEAAATKDKEYLCRSNLPEAPRDSSSAIRLIRLLAPNPWTLYAALDLRRWIGDGEEGIEVTKQAIARASFTEPGSIAALLNFDLPVQLRKLTFERLDSEVEGRAALLNAAVNGLDVDGVRIREPRFSYMRRPDLSVYRIGLSWPRLEAAGVPIREPERMVELVRNQTERFKGSWASKTILRKVERGDLRDLEAAAAARSADGDPLERIVLVAMKALEAHSQEELF